MTPAAEQMILLCLFEGGPQRSMEFEDFAAVSSGRTSANLCENIRISLSPPQGASANPRKTLKVAAVHPGVASAKIEKYGFRKNSPSKEGKSDYAEAPQGRPQ